MDRRTLGTQGFDVSAEGLGCMGMTHAYGAGDEQSGLETIHRALGRAIPRTMSSARCASSASGSSPIRHSDAAFSPDRSARSPTSPRTTGAGGTRGFKSMRSRRISSSPTV